MCIHSRQKRAEIREYKKKKAQKKKERMNEIEEFREKEKGRWKDFTQKVQPPPHTHHLPMPHTLTEHPTHPHHTPSQNTHSPTPHTLTEYPLTHATHTCSHPKQRVGHLVLNSARVFLLYQILWKARLDHLPLCSLSTWLLLFVGWCGYV